jgi:putative nucleotidyltransferase with HDIG domain
MLTNVQPENRYGLKKILVVDDYSPTRSLIVESLHQSSKYHIKEAENGLEALRLFNENDFDLVITDIMMPGMSGMELLHQMREINPNIAVIMITGNPTTDLTVSAIKKGAVDFLTKPFDIDDLLFKVNLHLKEKEVLTGESLWKVLETERLKDKTVELSKQSYIYDSIEDSPMDNEMIFSKIAELALKLVDGEVCSIFLFDEQNNEFHEKVIKGNTEGPYKNYTSSPQASTIYHEVIKRKEAISIHSLEYPEIAPSLICAPLMIRNSILGVLSIRKRKDREAFNRKDLHHILSLTKRASLNLENKILYESIYFNIMDTLKSLISSIQARDHYTEEHSQRVTNEAVRLAENLRCSQKEIECLKIAGILHDVGKIAVPDSILLKPGKLTEEEYMIIKNHATIGENIVRPIMLLDQERRIIQCHHERWDGTGYPLGLKGEDIPYLARILSVVDSYDAMINNRPYCSAMSKEAAIDELIRNKGTQFDPSIVDAYLRIL